MLNQAPNLRPAINFQKSAELRYPQGTLQAVQCSGLNLFTVCSVYTYIAGICAIRLDEDKFGSREPIERWLRTLASSFPLPSIFNHITALVCTLSPKSRFPSKP